MKVKFSWLPNVAVFLVRERIFRPIRPYIIIMMTIGIAKKTVVDTSHNGKQSGFFNIAQKAESAICLPAKR